MPPKAKQFDLICLVLDVGQSSFRSKFVDSIQTCCSEFLQRRVYCESEDLLGLVVFGTKEANNPLHYPHVTVADVSDDSCLVLRADFRMLELLEKSLLGMASDCQGDWLHALMVAADLLETAEKGLPGQKVVSKRIMLFSDLGCPCDDSAFSSLVQSLQDQGTELVFIGPDWKDESSAEQPYASESSNADGKTMSSTQKASHGLIQELILATNGLSVNVDYALATFMNKERRKKKPFPWKADLQIGPDLVIPVVGYIRIRREAAKSWKMALASDCNSEHDDVECSMSELKKDVSYVRNNENIDTVALSEIIEGFKYGSELITMTEFDKAKLYKGGDCKSFQVIGFIQQSHIPLAYLLGDGCMVFHSEAAHQAAIQALTALAKALDEMEMAALVRRVYRAGSAPRLGVLVPTYMPDTEDPSQCQLSLVYVDLPFMEDVRTFAFPSLCPTKDGPHTPSEEQLRAMDQLIDAMTLHDTSVLQSEMTLNPYYQHVYQCLTDRALHPGKVLGKLSQHVEQMMQQPENVASKAQGSLQTLAGLFKLQAGSNATRHKQTGEAFFASKRRQEALADSESSQNGDSASKRLRPEDLSLESCSGQVSTTNPAQDFSSLLRQGFDFQAVAIQLEKVVLDLLRVTFGGDFSNKILSCLEAYRSECLTRRQPSLYNQFLRSLKPEVELSQRLVKNLWPLVTQQNMGLIDQTLDDGSSVSHEEAKAFYQLTRPDSDDTLPAPASKLEKTADDLLDDL